MQFTNPIGLLALSGLIVPLAIHLLSRKEGKVIRIGSIRHLEETSTKQFKSIRINEILLLILRSLLIIWIVLLISGLSWNSSGSGNSNWLLIEKGLERDRDFATLTDSLTKQGFELRALAPDFPLLTDSVHEAPGNYWQLIESLKQKSLNNVTVISANRVSAFQEKRIDLPENFSWITKPLSTHKAVVSAIAFAQDSVWTREGTFKNDQTEFETIKSRITPESKSFPADSIKIVFVRSKTYDYDGKIMRAALAAIDKFVPHKIVIEEFDETTFSGTTNADWIIWFSESEMPETNSPRIILKPQQGQRFLDQTKNNTWMISQRLTPANVLRENFSLSITNILFPEKEAWNKADSLDVRTLDEHVLVSEKKSVTEKNTAALAQTDSIWILLIVLTLLAERFVAYRRNQ
jgi:hypothetical protein